MGSPLGAAKYNSLLQGAANPDRLGTTALGLPAFSTGRKIRICRRHQTIEVSG